MLYPIHQFTKTIARQLGLISGRCRFYPTCTTYARQALKTHGPLRGSFLTLKRVLKCHPLHPGGYDPVPPKPVIKKNRLQITDHRLQCL